jgi:oligopeptide transport system ATP-binding protein
LPLLEIDNLKVAFDTEAGLVQAVDGVSLTLDKGRTLGLVGESGCGKSVTATSILRLVPSPPGKFLGGRILFNGTDILKLKTDELPKIRGKDIAMIFQDPLSSLNPVLRVGYQIEEAMAAHGKLPGKVARSRTIALLKEVRIPAAESRVDDYPHQFSGGMRQRAMIAMGLANKPSILIADEPTTALDVTVQAQILELLRDLNQSTRTAIILITHNMGVVAGICKRVIVMYAGRIVEEGPVEQIFKDPQHPYTWSLLQSIPRLDADRKDRLLSIEGLPPDLIKPPHGCRFHPRCRFKIEKCFHDDPPLMDVGPDQEAACWVTMRRALAGNGEVRA